MANQEHLSKLLEGVQAWHKWRADYPTTVVDLIETDLSKSDLSGLDLSGADLSGASLWQANLKGANLSGANLSRANITRANLEGANLSGLDLSGAELSGADLCGANLNGADLSGAYLCKAKLRGAYLSETNLERANLKGADLSGAHLSMAKLRWANLSDTNLFEADLREADLSEADLRGAKELFWANLSGANLRELNLSSSMEFSEFNLSGADFTFARLLGADFSGANLCKAKLLGADLSGADFSGANLSGADLQHASLVSTCFQQACLDHCLVYGVSVWNVDLKGASQHGLIITEDTENSITVDDLRLAQFIHLLLDTKEIRQVIDTITTKVVLILGRFTAERRAVLDAVSQQLKIRNYAPIIFDFDKPLSRDLTETIITLASMARFVIADISSAKSIPQELSHIIPYLPSVPIQPLLLFNDPEYAMFEHWRRFPWVLPEFIYEDEEHLLSSLAEKVIEPAERKRAEQIKT